MNDSQHISRDNKRVGKGMPSPKTSPGEHKVIAVDFDGCLCVNRWPEIGKANEALIERLKRARMEGHRLILFTCREGKLLQDAVTWCGERGLMFDAVNENLPERIAKYGGDCRKISADLYIDDRAFRIKAR